MGFIWLKIGTGQCEHGIGPLGSIKHSLSERLLAAAAVGCLSKGPRPLVAEPCEEGQLHVEANIAKCGESPRVCVHVLNICAPCVGSAPVATII